MTQGLSLSPDEYQSFWSECDQQPDFTPQRPGDKVLRSYSPDGKIIQRWDPSVLRAVGVPRHAEEMLTTYGLPLWVSGRIGTTPDFLTLPTFQGPSGVSHPQYRVLGRAGYKICFDVDRAWGLFSIDYQAARILPVNPRLDLMMETMLIWERHERRRNGALLRWTSDEIPVARALIEELRRDLVAAGSISDGPHDSEPFENYWASSLFWLRIDLLGE